MNDSRLFTNYLLNSKLNTYIKKVNGITDDNIYRAFLQQNGSKIMNNERAFMGSNKKCNFPPIDPLSKKE